MPVSPLSKLIVGCSEVDAYLAYAYYCVGESMRANYIN